ncbi:MAG: hypothetical protein K9H64_20265 [Bacteroidales bacterium]|nr:hypothetical protein [Bacteroidales bacterium]MCF8458387.1 hypothetical protein [Bacteroidales bacterium]
MRNVLLRILLLLLFIVLVYNLYQVINQDGNLVIYVQGQTDSLVQCKIYLNNEICLDKQLSFKDPHYFDLINASYNIGVTKIKVKTDFGTFQRKYFILGITWLFIKIENDKVEFDMKLIKPIII